MLITLAGLTISPAANVTLGPGLNHSCITPFMTLSR